MMLLLLPILAFATVFALTYGLLALRSAPDTQIEQRLERLQHQAVTFESSIVAERRPSPFLKLAGALGSGFNGQAWARQLEVELERADWPLRGGEFAALAAMCAVGAFGIGLLFLGGRGIVLGLIGAAAPWLALRFRQSARRRAFDGQIGDMLALVSSSLKAGYSFLQALELVAGEAPPPMSSEVARTLRAMSLGEPTEDALLDMCSRTRSADLDLVVTAVLIQRQVGGNLAEILDKIAFTIRERVRIRGEIKTLTAQGRISGLIIGALPVAIGAFIEVANPGYIGLLFSTTIGHVLLIGSVVSELVGIAVIKKIITIEV